MTPADPMTTTSPTSATTPLARPVATPAADHPTAGHRTWPGIVAAVLVAGLGLSAWIFWAQIRVAAGPILARVRGEHEPAAAGNGPPAAKPRSVPRLRNGQIVLPERSIQAMGIVAVTAQAQVDPIRLELLGTTEYITDTLTQVRPLFKGRVDKVHVNVNQPVKRGDPLVDLYSKDLAEAKNSYEVERIQWIYDKKLVETRETLVKTKAITQVVFDETKNNEMKSHKEYEVARGKLMVYGLTDAEVERVEDESGPEKARLTLRSPTDGYVIDRNVVKGNLYDENDTLLTIAPLDRLWVWGNVFESDLDLVRLGQSWEIGFPFMADKALGKVEYISNRVDPNTHAVRVRTSIPNLEGRLKSDMLVRGILQIDPVAGRTVIPRTALIVDGGKSFVFVRDPQHPDHFGRRPVDVAQEKDDHAVIAAGLKVGEEVVAVGGLLLAQVHDDLKLVASGAPAAPVEGAD